ncbi:hypothetical protein [Wolbachia endosymbiont of Aedes albopictus]|nr:hypothetical protein [Wolbachia endosymbiont of Aedes albopictus]UVW83687.1 hypothetical protein NHG98_04975 [Wolbachia endosymbiont of Aedes albopictus]
MTVRGGMKVKQFVIPQRDLLPRYRGGMTYGLPRFQCLTLDRCVYL